MKTLNISKYNTFTRSSIKFSELSIWLIFVESTTDWCKHYIIFIWSYLIPEILGKLGRSVDHSGYSIFYLIYFFYHFLPVIYRNLPVIYHHLYFTGELTTLGMWQLQPASYQSWMCWDEVVLHKPVEWMIEWVTVHLILPVSNCLAPSHLVHFVNTSCPPLGAVLIPSGVSLPCGPPTGGPRGILLVPDPLPRLSAGTTTDGPPAEPVPGTTSFDFFLPPFLPRPFPEPCWEDDIPEEFSIRKGGNLTPLRKPVTSAGFPDHNKVKNTYNKFKHFYEYKSDCNGRGEGRTKAEGSRTHKTRPRLGFASTHVA